MSDEKKPNEDQQAETKGEAASAQSPSPEKPKPKPKAKQPEPAPSLVLSSSPHVHTPESIESLMYTVILALLPAFIGAVVFFGWDALRVTAITIASCIVFEALCLKMMGMADRDFKRTLFDGSAVLTGLLLAMNLPANAPWWLCIAGGFVAMVIAKHVFGGLGANPFNPALVARIFLLIAWAKHMTSWPVPRFFSSAATINSDGLTAATPLGIISSAQDPEAGLEAVQAAFPLSHLFVGNIGGCLGETSALLLLIGGVFLIAKKVIRWEIPVFFIGTMFILSGIAWLIKPEVVPNPFFHIFAGGLFLGAFFMATDYVTSPMATKGMMIFGIGCGVITFVIRFFGTYPEGVSFAIVIMNSLVPLIDRYCVPSIIGIEKGEKAPA
ncbi:MAG: RnfABCDGE type electron transport complex subunit D [Candidatus Sumerlaeia bacterium]